MKRAIIGSDGCTVENVIVLPERPETQGIPAGIDLPDHAYIGPGMIWNGDPDTPRFDVAEQP